jgi:hypothetical protein
MSQENTAFTARLTRVVENAGGAYAVAKLIGVTSPSVYGWLAGARPYRTRLSELCSKLGVSLRWLETGEGEEEFSKAQQSFRHDSMHEDTPGTKNTDELARELADMIRGFEELPPAFEKIALQQIREHFAEFIRRAELRDSIRHPHPRVKYPTQKNHKKPNQ